jgi:hypothetical protein
MRASITSSTPSPSLAGGGPSGKNGERLGRTHGATLPQPGSSAGAGPPTRQVCLRPEPSTETGPAQNRHVNEWQGSPPRRLRRTRCLARLPSIPRRERRGARVVQRSSLCRKETTSARWAAAIAAASVEPQGPQTIEIHHLALQAHFRHTSLRAERKSSHGADRGSCFALGAGASPAV